MSSDFRLKLPVSFETCSARQLTHRHSRDTNTCAMLRDLFTATWFKFQASSFVAVTHKGTRPGDPAADVLFAFTLSALFRAIDASLDSQGLVDALPQVQQEPLVSCSDGAFHLQFASWADDFARPFVCDTSEGLLDKVRRATKCCTERASACGIELTFGCDKTAAVSDIETTQHLRDGDLRAHACGIAFVDEVACRDCVMPVAHAYKHLGGIFSATAKPDLEIFLRRAAAMGPIRPVRAKLFANRAVPLATRRTLLYALGLSRLVHGVGALHLNQKGHQRTWYSAYIGIWAHLLPGTPGTKPHSYQVLYVSKAPPPHLFVALQRAALLVRIISGGFTAVLHMLQLEWEAARDKSWLSQLVEDIRVVAQWVQTACNLQHTGWPLHALCQQVEANPQWWLSVVRQAIKAYAADIVRWHALPRVIAVPDGGSFKCHVCHDTFAQRSFLTIHLARRHQLLAPARHFAPNRQCVACLRTFATVMLAQAHLRRSPNCLRRAVWLMEPLDVEAISAAERDDKLSCKKIRGGGWQRQCTIAKAQQGEGPLNVTAVDVEQDPEAFAIAVTARHFRPRSEVSGWIAKYLADATRSGPRQRAACWWHAKPTD